MFRVVLYSPSLGVYLGKFLGLGFWSKLDPAGQTSVPTFSSIPDALDHANHWKDKIKDVVAVWVETKEENFATREECVAYGLPTWEVKM